MNKTKKKTWVLWCDFYKNKPCTVYDNKSYATTCLPDPDDKNWRVGRVRVEEIGGRR